MRKSELINVYAFASAVWSNFKIPGGNTLEAKTFDAVWFEVLKPYDIDLVLFATKEYAKTNTFCNVVQIAELCKTFSRIRENAYMTENDIYKEIRRAIKAFDKEKAFENLSAVAQSVVGYPGQLSSWGQMTTEQVEIMMQGLRKRIKDCMAQSELINSVKELANSTNFQLDFN